MNDPTVVEATMITRLARHLRRHGVDPGPVLEASGILPEQLDDPEVLYPLVVALRVFANTADVLQDPAVGISIALEAKPEDYGLIGYLWRHSNTLEAAFKTFAHFYSAFLAAADFEVRHEGVRTRLISRFAHEHPGLKYLRQEAIAACYVQTRDATVERWTPLSVSFREVVADPAPFEACFGTEVTFGAEEDELVLETKRLRLPNPGANPVLLTHLLEAAETHLARRRAASGQQVRLVRLNGCTVDLDRGAVRRGPETIALTTKERAILEYFVARPNQVVPREELERDIWGMGKAVLSHAPAVAIRRLRQKIEPPEADRPVNLVTVFGEGWRLVTQEPATT